MPFRQKKEKVTLHDMASLADASSWLSASSTIINIDNICFLTLQSALRTSMKANGSNTYKMPCLDKDKILRSTGALPTSIPCPEKSFVAAF